MSESMRRLLGAALGGAIGYGVFVALEAREIRALAVVGACLAIGAGIAGSGRRPAWGAVVALLAVAVTIVVEWRHHPFRAEESFPEFIRQIGSVTANSKLSYVAVALAGFWFGMGRRRRRGADRLA